MVTPFEITWSLQAEKDLKFIYCSYSSNSEDYANKLIAEIVLKVEKIAFPNQYQIDKILKPPYRRFFVKHWKIIHRPSNNQIFVYRIFDTRKEPNSIR